MVAMPGASEGRSMPASSFSGLPIATVPWLALPKSSASPAETNVLEIASVKPSPRSVAADRPLLLCMRLLDHCTGERRQRVGETVVAVNARDLFDQVDFAFEVQTPARQLYRVLAGHRAGRA